MLTTDLQTLGFTKNEMTVYLALIPLGQAKAGEIIKETDMHRNLVYMALEALQKRKLVSKTESRGVTIYRVLNPTQLLNEVKSRQALTASVVEELKVLQKKPPQQEIIIYEGIEEVRQREWKMYEDLPIGAILPVLNASSNWYRMMGEKLVKKIIDLQIRKKIHLQMIHSGLSTDDTSYIKNTKGLTEFKIIPTTAKETGDINILPDRVLIKSLAEPYSIIEIINKQAVENYRQYFRLLWEQKVVTMNGADGARQFLEDTLNYSDIYWIGGNGGVEKFHPEVWREHAAKRLTKKVFWHDLVDPKSELTTLLHNGQAIGEYYDAKELPEMVSSPSVICIYGNKVANIIWKENSVINIIEDKDLAEGYLKYFHYLWKQEVKTYTGWKEIEKLFNEELLPQQTPNSVEYLTCGSYGPGDQKTRERVVDFFTKYKLLRTKLKLHKKLLFFDKDRETVYEEFRRAGDPELKHVEFRFLPDEFYSPMQVSLTAGKAIVIMFSANPVATVYERPEIVASFKKQFDLLWSVGKK
ncbi:MAG: hypothetical protein A3F54_02735 [Candidatus Kerfeldbacteria bacterium RIFCSPHIGHO2_12_FULL_48_17]|uniref:Transcription regulator TrmB N-terminal domain-containing protein n=1 Tax=Candidatus Kerfeldbacteria bacterium RIFCSPHIGHO2_12_FULL_48_17 TaxID=1798542 RepID=A0A1G2B2Q2_9BACT|nr:MAG: hypothetical protein A3F54_02735 [Candidatus Kerfeldbacteria bacterium RIFCSPHIGHO2_12_FULL_48_17]